MSSKRTGKFMSEIYELIGLIEGVLGDGVITEVEKQRLDEWLNKHSQN